MTIGIDFDNTIVCYDHAFEAVGREEGLLPDDFRGGREAVKALLLRQRPDGYLWERLQGLVYGRCIGRATLFEGVIDFVRECRRRGFGPKIVSHKTVLAHHDPTGSNLRQCALAWMQAHGFFDPAGLGLSHEDVFFEDTRDDKVRRIRSIGCRVFVDDHPEVLAHADMPANCRRILFRSQADGPFERAATWQDVRHAVFGLE